MSILRWNVAIHEAGHVVLGLMAHVLVYGATVREDHSGLTEIRGAPWPSCVVDWGGLTAERLLLLPDEIDVTRSAVDMVNAKENAGRFVQWSESRRVAARLGPPPNTGSPEPVLPALDSAARADVQALVSQIEKVQEPRRAARVARLLIHAERTARERLSVNIVVVRTVAVALSNYGTLDQQELKEIFREGRLRQVEDDIEWRKKA